MKSFVLFLLLSSSVAFAKFTADDLKMDGRLDFGMKDGVTESADEIYQIEIDLETKRKNGNKLELEIESNNESNEFVLNEGFINHEFKNANRLSFGKGKKVLGFEYENPKRKRLAIKRSMIYQYMEDFSFVGYDFFAEYEWRTPESEEQKSKKLATLSIHSNQSEDIGLIYSRNLNPTSDSWKTFAWVLLQADKALRTYQTVGMAVLGMEKQTSDNQMSFELFYGKDPVKSEFERDFDNKEEVYFAGLKTEYALFFEDYHPYTQISYLAQRIDEPGFDRLQVLLGIRIPLDEDLSFAMEFDGRQQADQESPWTKYWDESQYKIELRYLF